MEHQGEPGRRASMALAALGVVFGDIGTSPLYTLHECVSPHHGVEPTPENVLGLLSLILWSLTMVVSVKYLAFIMKADNQGEGGIFALLALVPERVRKVGVHRFGWAAVLVAIGAALLYGDGMITPAISVLSAVEGLGVATPALRPAVIPLTCAVLIGLFAIQSRGTARVGRLFSPVMVVWFVTLAGLGVFHLVRHPAVLGAINPVHGVRFFAVHKLHGFAVLGSVVLAVTGGEALYADMGHFGRSPIRLAWWGLVMPSLALNYLGQGALMLAEPAARHNPFFGMVPAGGFTYALVGLSAAATVIASQALISGVFSLTHQAMQLDFFPRVTVHHTSREMAGQIYVPAVNWGLAIACVALVLAFRRASGLAAAYGIAVTGTMAVTSIVFFEVTRTTWKWPLSRSLPLLLLFLSFDLPFFGANLLKLVDGGYVPLLVGAVLFIVMLTWRRGRRIYARHLEASLPLLRTFAKRDLARIPSRAPGVGIFMSGEPERVPQALQNMAERLKVVPEVTVILRVKIIRAPRAHAADGHPVLALEKLAEGFFHLEIERGFMESPDVPKGLAAAVTRFGLPLDCARVTYYVGRKTFLATAAGDMGRWSESLFAFLARNAKPISDHFCIPAKQVVEIGSQIDL
jgi:KUP system potassium uptake protein